MIVGGWVCVGGFVCVHTCVCVCVCVCVCTRSARIVLCVKCTAQHQHIHQHNTHSTPHTPACIHPVNPPPAPPPLPSLPPSQGIATCHAIHPPLNPPPQPPTPTPTHPSLLLLSFDTLDTTSCLLLQDTQLLHHDVPGLVTDSRTLLAGYVYVEEHVYDPPCVEAHVSRGGVERVGREAQGRVLLLQVTPRMVHVIDTEVCVWREGVAGGRVVVNVAVMHNRLLCAVRMCVIVCCCFS